MVCEKIEMLAKNKNISVSKMFKDLNINKSQYSRYKNGETKPKTEILIKIAVDNNVSIDWLLEDEIEDYKKSLNI